MTLFAATLLKIWLLPSRNIPPESRTSGTCVQKSAYGYFTWQKSPPRLYQQQALTAAGDRRSAVTSDAPKAAITQVIVDGSNEMSIPVLMGPSEEVHSDKAHAYPSNCA